MGGDLIPWRVKAKFAAFVVKVHYPKCTIIIHTQPRIYQQTKVEVDNSLVDWTTIGKGQ